MQPRFNNWARSPILKSTVGGLLFGGLWGNWAYHCNIHFGTSKAIDAALTQFFFSFIVTLFFSLTVDHLYACSRTSLHRWVFAFALPVSFMFGSLALLHGLRGTPNVLLTVLPSTVIAALYCLFRIGRGAPGDQRSPP